MIYLTYMERYIALTAAIELFFFLGVGGMGDGGMGGGDGGGGWALDQLNIVKSCYHIPYVVNYCLFIIHILSSYQEFMGSYVSAHIYEWNSSFWYCLCMYDIHSEVIH